MGAEKKRDVRELPFDRPLMPQAGESARNRADRAWDQATAWLMAIGLAVVMMLTAWAGLLWPARVGSFAVAFTLLAIGVCIVGTLKARRYTREYRSWSIGAKGEAYISQQLDELKRRGYHVIDDVENHKGNVDHVLVGPGGVFAIETKTRQRPPGDKVRVAFDGKTLSINACTDNRWVTQAWAEARYVQSLISDLTGNQIKVQPVLVFIGANVQYGGDGSLWVMEETRFLNWMEGRSPRIKPKEADQIARALRGHFGAIRDRQPRES